MAAFEIYDRLNTITPDVDQTLSITPQGDLTERGSFSQAINRGDDGSEERISLATAPIFYVNFDYKVLTDADMGTLFDLYFDPSKACGKLNSFKWSSRTDGHTYVVRFDSELSRAGNHIERMRASDIRLRVLGRIAD